MDLSEFQWTRVDQSGPKWSRVDPSGPKWTQVDLSGLEWSRVDLSGQTPEFLCADLGSKRMSDCHVKIGGESLILKHWDAQQVWSLLSPAPQEL